MVEGILGSPWSRSNVINLELEESKAPNVHKNDFHCVGKVLSTSRAYMAVGDWAKSSMIL